MTQEQFYLNKIGRGCYKLPERPKPLEPENNNYLPGCVLRPTHSEYLIQENMLSEFSTPEQLAEVRSNLGITPLLEELNRQLDERVLTTQRAVVEQTLTDNENRVLSSHGLYLILQQYYTKNDLDSLTTKINELIANLIIVDSELSNKSTNPVLNKVLTDAINGIYEVIVNRIINPRKKDDGMGYNSYISVREELEAKVNLTELENFYNKEQVDAIKQNLQSQIDEAKNISNTVIELVQTAEYLERLKSIIFDDLTELIPTKVSDLENDSQYVTSSEVSSEVSSAVNTAVSNLVNGAPDALDTLKEIADALNNDKNLAATLTNQITAERTRAEGIEEALNTEKANISDLAKVATSGDYKDLKNVPVIEDNPGNREYVEIAGIKWATMNVGATSETDYGLYFQWGDTQGYTAEQVGSGEGQKYFGWADYKYGNGTSSPGATGMTKYNSTDGKTVLDLKDDAVRANWGGDWRMPTTEELQALGNAVNAVWTTDYNGSGINGLLCTDKTDSTKTLFFPAAGYASDGSVSNVDNVGDVWSSSLIYNVYAAWRLRFDSGTTSWYGGGYRCSGYSVRGVLDPTPINKLHKVAESGDYNDLENTPTDVSHFNNDAEYVTESELAPVAKSGSYTDLEDKPTIPAAQILSDWNLTDTSSKDYIKNKPTNVSLFTNDANYITKEELDNTEEVVAAALNDLNTNKADKAEVFPVKATYEEMVEMRDLEKFIPGLYYQITDYVTTSMAVNTQSMKHQFDVLVRADSTNTLNEQAWAVRHEGDTYFKDARLEAWELKYRLNNVWWSLKAGTLIEDENEGYTVLSIGTVDIDSETYILWDASGLFEDDYGFTRMVSRTKEVGAEMLQYDPETGEIVDGGYTTAIAEILGNYSESGKGTITWMKDEHDNECPYDFKNVQFKRWKVTDSMEGRTGFTDTYLGVFDYTAEKLSVKDADAFIWAYTFSSNAMGGEQTDYSLDGTHSVYGNIIKEMGDGSLPDNVFFGKNCYTNTLSQNCQNNSFSQGCQYNIFSQDCWNNSFSQNCIRNSFSQNCNSNSFSQDCSRNSFSQNCSQNSFLQNCWNNSFSQNCGSNSFSQSCIRNSFSQNCSSNSFSQDCWYNSFSQNVQYVKLSSNYMQQVIVESGNQHLNVVCNQSTSASQPCRNIKIEQGVGNTTSEKTVTITTNNQNYQTVVKNANSVEVTA